jgi:molybdopterin-guanine dinucleotide biosynthesis protein B
MNKNNNTAPIFGVIGWKDSGKTTLVERLIEEFTIRGKVVSAIKHAHHSFEIDHKDRDSYKFRSAGARRTVVISRNRWAMIHELRQEEEPPLEEILEHVGKCDLVLIEGYKGAAFAKIEARNTANNNKSLSPEDDHIVALAIRGEIKPDRLPVFDIDDISAIAEFIAEQTGVDL